MSNSRSDTTKLLYQIATKTLDWFYQTLKGEDYSEHSYLWFFVNFPQGYNIDEWTISQFTPEKPAPYIDCSGSKYKNMSPMNYNYLLGLVPNKPNK